MDYCDVLSCSSFKPCLEHKKWTDHKSNANLIWAVDNRFVVSLEKPSPSVLQEAVAAMGVGVVVTMSSSPLSPDAFVAAFGKSDETRMLKCRTQTDLSSVPTFSLYTCESVDLDVYHFPLESHNEPTVIQLDCFLELCEQTFARKRTVLLVYTAPFKLALSSTEQKNLDHSVSVKSLTANLSVLTFIPGLLVTCWIVQNTVRKRTEEEELEENPQIVCEEAVAYVSTRFGLAESSVPMFLIDFWQLCECRKTVSKLKSLQFQPSKQGHPDFDLTMTKAFTHKRRHSGGESD